MMKDDDQTQRLAPGAGAFRCLKRSMKQSFEFTSDIKDFLFYGWTSSMVGGLIGTILATASVAILMEGAKVFGSVLEEWSPHVVYNQGSSLNTASPPPRPPPLLSLISRSDNTSVRRVALRVAQSLIHLLKFLLGYLLMLAVMSYNAWILIATVAGSGLGYFIFGCYRRRENEDFPEDGARSRESPSRSSDLSDLAGVGEGGRALLTH